MINDNENNNNIIPSQERGNSVNQQRLLWVNRIKRRRGFTC